MENHFTRRAFLKTSAMAAPAAALVLPSSATAAPDTPSKTPPLKLGLMTYTLGAKWDVDTVIANLKQAKWEHAELRTTHAHGVEVGLSKQQRADVRAKFEDAGLALSLASGFSYHSEDPAVVRKNIEGTKEYTMLARDIGAKGIRVFPNAVPADDPEAEERTLRRIAKAAAEAATFAADYGVEIRLANHGRGTNRVTRIKRVFDYADCPQLRMNWNCDGSDIEEPGFEANFNSVKDRIGNIHLHDLTNEKYPYRKLFAMLRESGYQGYCDAEVGPSLEPVKFMQYYRAVFLALQNEI